MNPCRFFLAGAFAAALFTNGMSAQTQIGTRYIEAGLGYIDVSDDFGTTGEASYSNINFPLCDWFDLQASLVDYDYDSDYVGHDANGTPVVWDQDGYGANIAGVFYKAVRDYKAFSKVTLGAEHMHLRDGMINDDDVAYLWSIGGGAEWEIRDKLSAGFWFAYEDSFDTIELDGYEFQHDGVISGGVFAHYRVTKMFGLEGGLGVNDEWDFIFSVGGSVTF